MNFSAQYFYTKGNKASFSYVQDNWVQKLRIYLNGKLFFTWSYMLQIPSISKEYFVLEICMSRSHQYIWFSCYRLFELRGWASCLLTTSIWKAIKVVVPVMAFGFLGDMSHRPFSASEAPGFPKGCCHHNLKTSCQTGWYNSLLQNMTENVT